MSNELTTHHRGESMIDIKEELKKIKSKIDLQARIEYENQSPVDETILKSKLVVEDAPPEFKKVINNHFWDIASQTNPQGPVQPNTTEEAYNDGELESQEEITELKAEIARLKGVTP